MRWHADIFAVQIEGLEMQVDSRSTLISNIVYLAGYQVTVTWADGLSEIKDLEPLILNRRALSRLKDNSVAFRTMAVSADGARVHWADDETVSARSIFRLPHTGMTANEFRSAMADLHLTSEALGSILGLSRRAVTNYRTGSPIPKSVVLALRYILLTWET
jgi:hypothetical protein